MNRTNKTRQPLRFRITTELHDSGYQWLEQLDAQGQVLHGHDVLQISVRGEEYAPDVGIDVRQEDDGTFTLRLWAKRLGESLEADHEFEACRIRLNVKRKEGES